MTRHPDEGWSLSEGFSLRIRKPVAWSEDGHNQGLTDWLLSGSLFGERASNMLAVSDPVCRAATSTFGMLGTHGRVAAESALQAAVGARALQTARSH